MNTSCSSDQVETTPKYSVKYQYVHLFVLQRLLKVTVASQMPMMLSSQYQSILLNNRDLLYGMCDSSWFKKSLKSQEILSEPVGLQGFPFQN